MANELTDREKLDIIKTNISDLVNYYDENNTMDTIPNYVWSIYLSIEKYSK